MSAVPGGILKLRPAYYMEQVDVICEVVRRCFG